MDCLFISGFPRTGKNFTTVRIAHFLIDMGHKHDDGDPIPLRGTGGNFAVVIKHSNSLRRILLNTKSDFEVNAKQLLDFYHSHELIDILITTIRDAGPERDVMQNAVQQLQPVDVVEIPLARISGRRPDRDRAVNAYLDRIETLAKFILRRLPFQV